MTTESFYRTVMQVTGQGELHAAQRATAGVFHALRDRLTPDEADQLAAQLPQGLKSVWEEGDRPDRRPLRMNRREFLERVGREAGLSSPEERRRVMLAVFGALKRQISPGEAADVLAQLPKDLKEAWNEARA